jgi:hypothetical protein
VSHGPPDDTPREEYAPKPAVSRSSPKPLDGRCQSCQCYVGRDSLVWDHCHTGGAGRGWCCDDCNLALTEHVLEYWDLVKAYAGGHKCPPGLFTLPRAAAIQTPRSEYTRPLRLNNGGGDGRIIQVSRHQGWFSIEQVAVVLGISTPTARDLVNGRRGRAWPAKRNDDGSYLVPTESVLALINERTKKGRL